MAQHMQNPLVQPLPQRCQSFVGLLQQAQNNRELQILVNDIVKNIFGDAYSACGWNMKNVSKSQNQYEFTIIKSFLSPQGTFFKVLYKLLSDSNVCFEFPISNFPASTRHCFEDGTHSSYYQSKLHTPLGMSNPKSIFLNPVEFFIFSFLHHLVHNPLAKGPQAQVAADSVYISLLEDYLNNFVPISGNVAVPHVNPHVWSPPPTPSAVTSTPARKVTLFKSSLIGNMPSPMTPSVAQTQQNDAWPTEAFIQATIDLWLDCKVKEYHSQMSLDTSASFLQLGHENIAIPSADLVRCVRIFVKHMHSFGNTPAPSGLSAIGAIKRSYISLIQKEMYVFLHHAVDRWPLDTSFRIVLETWLSYIQPWRYTGQSETEERVVDPKWQFFVAENLLFYTQFFGKILQRCTRMELVYPKHALMLFRVAKVFSQKGLGRMIANAENAFNYGSSPRQRGSPDSELVGIVRHHTVQLEGPGYHHIFMFGPQVSNVVNQVIHLAEQAKLRLQHNQLSKPEDEVATFQSAWLKKISSYFHAVPAENNNQIEDYKKAFDHLDASVVQLAALFELEIPQLDYDVDTAHQSLSNSSGSARPFDLSGGSPRFGIPTLSSSPRNDFEGSLNKTDMTSPKRLEGIVPLRRFDLAYRGNPDKAPVTSYEERIFVTILNALSDWINSKFGGEMIELYTAPGFKGKFARQILTPPTTYLEMLREGSRKVYREVELPPRLHLRPLASRGVLLLCFILFLFFYFFMKWSTSSMFVTTILGLTIYFSVKAAVGN